MVYGCLWWIKTTREAIHVSFIMLIWMRAGCVLVQFMISMSHKKNMGLFFCFPFGTFSFCFFAFWAFPLNETCNMTKHKNGTFKALKLGGGFKDLLCSLLLGEMIPLANIFQMVWNHQLEISLHSRLLLEEFGPAPGEAKEYMHPSGLVVCFFGTCHCRCLDVPPISRL